MVGELSLEKHLRGEYGVLHWDVEGGLQARMLYAFSLLKEQGDEVGCRTWLWSMHDEVTVGRVRAAEGSISAALRPERFDLMEADL